MTEPSIEDVLEVLENAAKEYDAEGRHSRCDYMRLAARHLRALARKSETPSEDNGQ